MAGRLDRLYHINQNYTWKLYIVQNLHLIISITYYNLNLNLVSNTSKPRDAALHEFISPYIFTKCFCCFVKFLSSGNTKERIYFPSEYKAQMIDVCSCCIARYISLKTFKYFFLPLTWQVMQREYKKPQTQIHTYGNWKSNLKSNASEDIWQYEVCIA